MGVFYWEEGSHMQNSDSDRSEQDIARERARKRHNEAQMKKLENMLGTVDHIRSSIYQIFEAPVISNPKPDAVKRTVKLYIEMVGYGITTLTESGAHVKNALNYAHQAQKKPQLIDPIILQHQQQLFEQHQWSESIKERAKACNTWYDNELMSKFPMRENSMHKSQSAQSLVMVSLKGILKAAVLFEDKDFTNGRLHAIRVSVFGYDEKPNVWKRSKYGIFRRITEHAFQISTFFANQYPEVALQRLLTWLSFYKTLYSEGCYICKQVLYFDSEENCLLPPTYRFLNGQSCHSQCKPDTI